MSLAIKQRINFNLFQFASVFLSTFTLAFICGSLSFIPHGTNAETADSTINVNLSSVLSMQTDTANLVLSVTPTPSGTTASGNIGINISTNNVTGYTLSMRLIGASTSLTHTNGTSTVANTTNSSPSTLANNTWGYNLGAGATTFKSLPDIGTQTSIVTSPNPTETSTTTVAIGAKVDTTLPAGYYSNTIEFTAVTNPPPLIMAKTGDPIQTVTTATCPTTMIRVNDARDDASYWIQKLADGKCWMLTNLAYGMVVEAPTHMET